MNNTVVNLILTLARFLPFLAFVLLNAKANLKKPFRSRQFPMPVLALVYCVLMLIFARQLHGYLLRLLQALPGLLDRLSRLAAGVSFLAGLQPFLANLSDRLLQWVQNMNIPYVMLFVFSAAMMLVHILLKRILVGIFKGLFRSSAVHDALVQFFYEQDEDTGLWYVKPGMGQARTYLKTFYVGAAVIAVAAAIAAAELYRTGTLTEPFYPAFAIIVIGELYFFLAGQTKQEAEEQIEGEGEQTKSIYNYALLRKELRALFGDKLTAEDTSVNMGLANAISNHDLLDRIESSEEPAEEAYAIFMRRQLEAGLALDQNYLISGLELLRGRSILFNNPFYYDLVPYAFYPMNRTLLRHKKVLVILGRHGAEADIARWCRTGLHAVTNLEELWHVDVLTDQPKETDVGIITRSSVHDYDLHQANAAFFSQVEFVVLLEPSRLVTTAQVGVNAIVRLCGGGSGKITYCAVDKNCDGMVDALSHILMTSLTEVSATEKHLGVCSHMCWKPDRELLQHRMLPNISRYLGMGTELSFVALKNQVSRARWYGGDAFPVEDMRWIAGQYYHDLLSYANLPTTQETMDRSFVVSHNLYDGGKEDNCYLTVEDEACNMFEMKRCFSTRARNQSFINVISPEYLLHDYMSANSSIFNADAKAIPYIVADYARTRRNVVLRLCLRMSMGQVSLDQVRHELMLIDVDTRDALESLWHEICCFGCPAGDGPETDERGREILTLGEKPYHADVLKLRRQYSDKSGKMEDMVYIEDHRFSRALLGDLQNAGYIAEQEDGQRLYLGSELSGQIYQKYLPGQFFTFSGKYYEMLSVTADGQVLVRRAADHITGRPVYRQVREYGIANAVDSTAVGACRDAGDIRMTRQYADIRVRTPAYWQMAQRGDFAGGRRVTISGVPEREYRNKQLLRVDFTRPDGGLTPEIRMTLTLLMNEVFVTLFGDNAAYITAVTPGTMEQPITCSIRSEGAYTPDPDAIYIIEDSQLDLGLLVAVERNLDRIFTIIRDYLDWHFEELDRSLNPPPAPVTPDYTQTEEPEEGETKKKGFFGRLIQRIRDFFRKLFRRKKKDPGDEPADETGVPAEEPQDGETAPQTGGQEPETRENALFSVRADTAGPEPEADIEFEGDGAVRVTEGDHPVPNEPAPYHERYYLLYHGTQVPSQLDLQGTLDFLTGLGYAGGELEQARRGKDVAEQIERTYNPKKRGAHFCDFCGVEIVGAESEVLKDGRERCMNCGRTAIRTEEEFRSLYQSVLRGMASFYGVRITAPIQVKMVNAKRLHRRLGKTFVPTGNPDGRVLGVAIRDKDGYSILVENGAPRMAAVTTMAHEMTHIWQYLNWDAGQIRDLYGKDRELEIYEGMAKWSEIQYAYLMGEPAIAKREEILTRLRDDEYGRGFLMYVDRYPLSEGTRLEGDTPFDDKTRPL